MKVNYNGKSYDAYRLIMTKENAIDIVNGKKKIEIRAFNEYYQNIFFEKSKINDEKTPLVDRIKDISVIRFTNYNQSWHLDVAIKDVDIYVLDKTDIEILNEDYDFHDLDDELEKYKDTPSEELPMFFGFGLGEILNRSGI